MLMLRNVENAKQYLAMLNKDEITLGLEIYYLRVDELTLGLLGLEKRNQDHRATAG